MGFIKTSVAKLFGPAWSTLSWQEKQLAAAAVFPENSADPDHFVDPSPYGAIYLGSASVETINGGSSRDYILAGASADSINGYGGDDFINGGSGQDNITAGAGNDLIIYDSTDVRIHGGAGIDTLLVRDRGTTFSGSASIYSVEVIDLANGFRDNIEFSNQALGGGRDRELRITGDAGDVLNFATTVAANFLGTVTENGILFDRYKIGTTSFGVQQGVIVQRGLAPELAAPASISVAENGLFAIDLFATDDRSAEGAGLIYTIGGGADAGLFAIDATTGVLSFLSAPDFEAPVDADDDNAYDVIVQVTDGNGLTDSRAISVQVTDVLDTAGPTLIAPASVAAAEGSLQVVDLDTTHLTESEGAGLLYAITGGADELVFVIDAETGVLSFASAPDFEMPTDQGGDNVYDVTVTVTDSAGLSDSHDLAVGVTDVFENKAPTLNLPTQVTAAENQTIAFDLSATDDADQEGAGLSYTITGGADALHFSIDSATGLLHFVSAPDFEAPSDLDGNNIYDVRIGVTDSGGLSSEQDLQVQITDRQTMQFIFTSGQSLSVGTTATPAVLSNSPVYPTNALALNFGANGYVNQGWQTKTVNPALFQGFRPLQEYGSETHVSSMINRLIYEFQSAGLDSPVFTHVNTGTGGKNILQLMTGAQDIYSDVASALAATGTDDVFAVDNLNGTFSYFRNTGSGSQGYGTSSGRPVFFDNLVTQLTLGVTEALKQGYDVSKEVVLNWIQGQADSGRGDVPFGYEFLLGKYFDKLEAVVENLLGNSADVLGMVSQHRGYGNKGVAIDQIEFINGQANIVFGAPEYQFEARFPARVAGDYTHLSPEGYYMMGQQLGANLFDALTGNENTPILISSVTKVAPDMLQVDFSGVDNALVDDPSIFAAANGFHPPSDFGFRLYTMTGVKGRGLPDIINAQIIDADSVLLQFDKTVSGQFRLYLGRTEEDLLDPAFGSLVGFGGTTLRDSVAVAALPAPSGAALADPFIYEYAPIQYMNIDLV